MPHIHTNPGEHDLTASAFIVDISEEEPKLWLHEHKLLGKWLQFGGHVELQENPWQAINHEIEEESGFDMSQLHLLQPKLRLELLPTAQQIPQPVVINSHKFSESSDHFHTDIAFAFVAREEPKNLVREGESNTLRLFSLEEIKNAEPSLIMPNVRRISMFVMQQVISEWEPVSCSEFNR